MAKNVKKLAEMIDITDDTEVEPVGLTRKWGDYGGYQAWKNTLSLGSGFQSKYCSWDMHVRDFADVRISASEQ